MLAGCYSTGLRFPPHVHSIAIPVFRNETNIRGLEFLMTDTVRRLFLETSDVRLVTSERDADAVIVGRVVNVTYPVLVGASRERILEGSATVTVSAELVETSTGRVLARVSGTDLAEFSTALGETRKTAEEEVMAELSRKLLLGLSQRSRDTQEGDPTTRPRPNDRR